MMEKMSENKYLTDENKASRKKCEEIIKNLRAANERLKAQIKRAYEEGVADGRQQERSRIQSVLGFRA